MKHHVQVGSKHELVMIEVGEHTLSQRRVMKERSMKSLLIADPLFGCDTPQKHFNKKKHRCFLDMDRC